MVQIQEKKLLQLLRSSVQDSKAAALSAISGVTFMEGLKADGAPMAVRYYTDEAKTPAKVETLFVIFYSKDNNNLVTHYTIFDNQSEMEAEFEKVVDVIGIPGLDGADGKDGKDALADALSGTTYAKDGAKGEDGETIVDAIKALDDAIVANKVKSSDNTIIVGTPTTAGTDLSVNVDELTIVKSGTDGKISTAVKIQYVAAQTEVGSTAVTPAHIALMDKEGTELSIVEVSEIIGGGILTASTYDKTTGILSLYFVGQDDPVEINLKEMLDIDDVIIGEKSQDYLKVTLDTTAESSGMVLDVKMGEVTTVVYTEETAAEENAKHEGETGYTPVKAGDVVVSATTGLADAEDVASAMTDAVEALEDQIKELQANSLTGVSVNGIEASYDIEGDTTHVAVVINGNDIEVASAYTEVEYAKEFAEKEGVAAVASGDTVAQAVEKVEGTLKVLVDEVLDNEEVAEKAIEAVANAAGTIDSDGVITYVKHQDNEILSVATSLNEADLLLAEAIKKTEEKSATVVTQLPDAGNKPTIGANVTSTVDETTKATTYYVDVNFDFGQVNI